MDTVIINIVGFTVRLIFKPTEEWKFAKEKLQKEILNYVKNFITKESKRIDAEIVITDEVLSEIVQRKKDSKNFIQFYHKLNKKTYITYVQLSIFQFQMLLRIVMQNLIRQHKGFILHAAVNHVHETAYLFIGPSGRGKSTITRLLQSKYPKLSDDTIMVRRIGQEYRMFQTPFIEKNWVDKKPGEFIIGKIFFIHQSKTYRYQRIKDKKAIYQTLLPQLMMDQSSAENDVAEFARFIRKHNSFYHLYFGVDGAKVCELIESIL